MPAVSQAQPRAMYAASAGHSTLGIPKKVGRDFVSASRGVRNLPERKKPVTASKARAIAHDVVGEHINHQAPAGHKGIATQEHVKRLAQALRAR